MTGRSLAHTKCNGSALRPSRSHRNIRSTLITERFLIDNTPMCSQCPFECASSTSARVGEHKNCMQKLLDANSTVLRMLMTSCDHRLTDLAVAQFPL